MTDLRFQDLASLSKDLNEASDSLSKQISQVEAALNDLKLGVWAWVTVSKHETDSEFKVNGRPETVTKVEDVGYGKLNGKWGLLFLTTFEEHPDIERMVPLQDAPRMERLAAVDKLPDLVMAIQAKAREVTQSALSKASQVSELAAALKRAAK